MCDVCGGQKRASASLELKCQMLVSHHVRAGNRTQVLSKSRKCSHQLSHDLLFSVSLCEYHAHVVALEGDGATGDYEVLGMKLRSSGRAASIHLLSHLPILLITPSRFSLKSNTAFGGVPSPENSMERSHAPLLVLRA